jgi:predicted aspartyl protease
VLITINATGRFYKVLLDTGAERTSIDQSLAQELGLTLIPAKADEIIELAVAKLTAPRIGSVVATAQFIFPCSDKEAI